MLLTRLEIMERVESEMGENGFMMSIKDNEIYVPMRLSGLYRAAGVSLFIMDDVGGVIATLRGFVPTFGSSKTVVYDDWRDELA